MLTNATIPMDVESFTDLPLKSFTIELDGVEHYFTVPYNTLMGCEWDGHDDTLAGVEKSVAVAAVIEDNAHLQYCASCTKDMIDGMAIEGGVVTAMQFRTW